MWIPVSILSVSILTRVYFDTFIPSRGNMAHSNDQQLANLRYRRKDSKARLPKWQLYQDAYTGEGGFSDGRYLKQATRETSDYYKTRQESPTYLNLFMPSVEKFHGWLTAGPSPNIKGSPQFELFVKNSGLVDHVRKLSRIALINGLGHGVMDAPFEVTGEPYLVAYKPQDLFNWEDMQDEGGESTGFYTQAKIGIETVETDVTKAGETDIEQFFIWQPELSQRWKIDEKKAAPDGKKKTNYDKAPMVTLSLVLGNKSGNNVSLFDSLSRMSKRLFNVMSKMEAFEDNKLVNALLAIPEPPGTSGGGDPETVNTTPEQSWTGSANDSGEPSAYKHVKEANVITFDPSEGGKPEMLYGDVSALTEWRILIGELIEWSAYVSGMRGPAAYLNPKSGEAYKQEFVDTRAILKTFSIQIEEYIKRLAVIWEMVTGSNNALTSVEWPVGEPDNDILTLDDLDLMADSKAAKSITFLKQVMKEQARLITRGDRELQLKINEEIDALPEDMDVIPVRPIGSVPIESN